MDGGASASASEVVSVTAQKQGKEEESNHKRTCSTILPGTTNECKKVKPSSAGSNPEDSEILKKVEPEVDWICGACRRRNDFSKKSCTCWETYLREGTRFGTQKPNITWTCGACKMNNLSEKYWVWCESCRHWFHRNCVNIATPYVPGIKYKCTACTASENLRIARKRKVPRKDGAKFEPPIDEPEVDWMCGACGGRNDFSKKSCTCWETYVSDGTFFGKHQPKLDWNCGACGINNLPEKYWVWCESCRHWFHRNCVNISTPYVPGVEYKCTICTYKENLRIARKRKVPQKDGAKFEPPKDEPEVDWMCGACGGINEFSKKSCSCWDAYVPDATFFAKHQPNVDWTCGGCGINNMPEKYWVRCEFCIGWFHRNCVNIETPYVPGVKYKCASCTEILKPI